MKIFVSGATGFIGSRLALRLADEGNQVHALYRDDKKAEIIKHPNIILFKGDILDFESLKTATQDCSQVYHTAAFAKVWDKDISSIYRLNIEGAMNVIKAGIQNGVTRIVITSTAGVFGPSISESYVDENTPKPKQYFIDYESSKAILEQVLCTLSTAGTDVVIVNPTRVFGPGVLSESNGVTKMIQKYIKGKWRIIPGDGNRIGNYVFVEDVVTGHILAMEKGKSGEQYILGGTNISYNNFFKELAELSGTKTRMIQIPIYLMLGLSSVMLFVAKLTGKSPLITPSLVRKFNHNWVVSSSKTEKELNYRPMDFKTGATHTINWLKTLG